MKASALFTIQEQQEIVSAIQEAELNTSGEIRIHIGSYCKEEPMEYAIKIFNLLEMYKTEQRNGVLIYIAIKSKKFAIIGDEGINNLIPSNFWESTKQIMSDYFAHGEFVEGIARAVAKVGEQLKQFFPYQSGDKNELSNDISFENNN